MSESPRRFLFFTIFHNSDLLCRFFSCSFSFLCRKYRDLDGVGNVSRFRGKRIIGVLASATEVGGEEQEEMNDLIDLLGYKKICTQGLGYGDDPCSPSQASGDSRDAPASSDAPGTGPTAPPSAVPRRSGRSFFAPMRGPAMLVRPRVVNTRVAGFRIAF